MRYKADKDRLDNLLRLIRRYKRNGDIDIYRLIIKEEDDVLLNLPPYSVHGGYLKNICMGMFFFGQPSNAKVYEVLGKCGIEVVESEPVESGDGVPF